MDSMMFAILGLGMLWLALRRPRRPRRPQGLMVQNKPWWKERKNRG